MATSLTHRLRDGIAAAQAKQFDRARTLLEQVAKESPNEALAWFWLAIASPTADAALPCLRRVLTIDPSHAQAGAALAKMLVSHAATVAAAGHRAEARALAIEASTLTPASDVVWLALASLTDDQGERIEALRQAVALNPEQPQIRTRLRQAILYRALMIGKTDRAEARLLFREAAELDPRDPRVWQALANLADTPSDAIEALRTLLRLAPAHAAGRTGLKRALAADARALAGAGRLIEACGRWREAVALDNQDVEAWLGLAEATVDEDEAQRAIETAYGINPDDERAAAAMAGLREDLDPSAFEAPADAFSRFEPPSDVFATLEPEGDVLAQLDEAANQLPTFAVEAPAPVRRKAAPVAQVAAPAPVVPAPAPPVVRPAMHEAPAAVVAPAIVPPIAPAEPIVAHVLVAAAPESNGSNGSSRRTVMVVDDSPTIRKILGLTLERAGYKVVAEPDGESAVERLGHVIPDLILLDIAMPKLDGYEVCKRIKKDPRTAHVPVVMLSGKDAFFDKVKGHMAGASEYLTKPFETPAVLAVVATHCQPAAEVVHG